MRTADIGWAGLLYWVGDDCQMHARFVPPRRFDRATRALGPLPRRVHRSRLPFDTYAEMETLSAAERTRIRAEKRRLDEMHQRILADEAKENEKAAKKALREHLRAVPSEPKLRKAPKPRRHARADSYDPWRPWHSRLGQRVAFHPRFKTMRVVSWGPASSPAVCTACIDLFLRIGTKLEVISVLDISHPQRNQWHVA